MKIVVVGGGTAGWIAAYFISKAQPNCHEITIIESSKIGIIGTGEGSTGTLVSLLIGGYFDYTVDPNDFIQKTDATAKIGIRHQNWSSVGSNYFAPIDVSPTGFQLDDYIFKHVLSNYGNKNIHLASELGIRYQNKKINQIPALHFDGHKVGLFFKEICLMDGVSVIDDVVTDIKVGSDGNIVSIITENKQNIDGDLFIDATGFARILMNKLNVNWISKQDVLPVNTAMPFQIEYENDEEIVQETKAIALSSGWMWNIPLKTRKGCGYVFDKNFISRDEAQKEVEEYLNKKIKPIKFIEFDAGYMEKTLKNNVLSVGLASSFFEPLEATSINNTIIQIAIFVKEFLTSDPKTTFTTINEDIYNRRIDLLNRLTADFISLHYQGGRNDTPFWKNIKDNKIGTEYALETVERAKIKIPGYSSFEGMIGSPSAPLANWILAGLNIINGDQAKNELNLSGLKEYSKEKYNNFIKSI